MQDAKQDANGSPSGQGSQLSEPDGFLVLRPSIPLNPSMLEWLRGLMDQVGEQMQMIPVLLPFGAPGNEDESGALIAAMNAQTTAIGALAASNEALVQAMAEAEGVDTEDVPATVGLNGRAL